MRMTPRMIVIGGLAVVLTVVAFVVFLPYAVFKPAPTITTTPYTALGGRGPQALQGQRLRLLPQPVHAAEGRHPFQAERGRQLRLRPAAPARHAADGTRSLEHRLQARRRVGGRPPEGPAEVHSELDHAGFSYLTTPQLKAIVAYLNRLGKQAEREHGPDDPDEVLRHEAPYEVDIDTWNKGRAIYAERCLTCHGCAGKGDGPYAYLNNARPADLRQPRFQNLKPSWDFWRVSEGVPAR